MAHLSAGTGSLTSANSVAVACIYFGKITGKTVSVVKMQRSL